VTHTRQKALPELRRQGFFTCLSTRSIGVEDHIDDAPAAVRDQEEIAARAHPVKPERGWAQTEITPVVNDHVAGHGDEALTAHPDAMRRTEAVDVAVEDRSV